MEKKLTTISAHSEKYFKKQGLIAITNRLALFIDGKPCRRWWFANKKNRVLLSVEYGLIDREAINFLTNEISSS